MSICLAGQLSDRPHILHRAHRKQLDLGEPLTISHAHLGSVQLHVLVTGNLDGQEMRNRLLILAFHFTKPHHDFYRSQIPRIRLVLKTLCIMKLLRHLHHLPKSQRTDIGRTGAMII